MPVRKRLDVVASARSVLQVERDVVDENIRYVRQIKNSLGPKGNGLSFEIRPDTGFRWLRTQKGIEQPLANQTIESLPKNKHELAAIVITRALRSGPVPSMEIRSLMAEYNIGEKTMNDVKTVLGIVSYRKMRKWYWKLPTEVNQSNNKSYAESPS